MSNQNTKKKIKIKIKKEVKQKEVADPLKQDLCKKQRKRYNRYIREGMQREEAKKRAIDPNAYELAARKKAKNVAPPAASVGGKRKAPVPAKAVAPKRAKSVPEAERSIDMAILANTYPLRILRRSEAKKVEAALIEEMLKGCPHSINFDGVHFKDGVIIVKCRDNRSKEWMELTVPKVHVLSNVLLSSCPVADLPSMKIVKIHLPRTEGQNAMRLLREQNKDLDSDAWELLSNCLTREGGHLVTLGLKPRSLELLQQNALKVSYRFEQLPCRIYEDQTAQGDDEEVENAMWYVDIPDVHSHREEDKLIL
ncbi:uncharacterized protein LOC117584903 [Drosophila guanche]|nr:uncharacterized protein LOC117584903 [Drosophila guanche]